MFINKLYLLNKEKILISELIFIRLNHLDSLSHIDNRDITHPNIILDEIGLKPIKVWDNLDKKKVCLEISNEVKNKSGIYLIGNKITRNTYVGSGSDNKIYTRFRNHLYNNNGSKLVKKSLDKYGIQNFFFAILEYFPVKITKENNKELMLLETEYIKEIGPKYNILTEAGNSFGYKHSEEVLLKMKENYSEKNRERLREWQKSRKNNWTESEKLKLREIALNKPSDYLTSQGREKLRNINKKGVNIIDINTNEILCTFNSTNQTSHYLCCSVKTIQRAFNLGTISIPDLFIPFLNQSHIDNHNSIKEYIDTSKLYLYDYKKGAKVGRIKLRGSNTTYKYFTQFKISHISS